jgi:hypothetical protein
MSTPFDVTQSLLGPDGGQIAIAFGAGCTAGYAFCIRTVYKMLGKHADKQHADCLEHVESLRADNRALNERMTILEDRLYTGTVRQMTQMRESGIRVLGEEKIGPKND